MNNKAKETIKAARVLAVLALQGHTYKGDLECKGAADTIIENTDMMGKLIVDSAVKVVSYHVPPEFQQETESTEVYDEH